MAPLGTDRPGGFTIVELLMVIALMGLVMAFALPKLDFSAYRINGAVRGASALMARAQRLAVTEQADVNVLFDTAHAAIRIHEDVNNNNAVDPGERVRSYPLGEGVVYGLGGAPVHTYPSPVSFTRQLNGMPELIFRRDGSASENGGFYLTTTQAVNAARPGDARAVELTRATGRVDWFRYDGTQWVRKF